MKLQPVPLVGGCYADDTRPFSSQDCINWIPERAEVAGARSAERLLQPPGLSLFSAGDGLIPLGGDYLINELGEFILDDLGRFLTA